MPETQKKLSEPKMRVSESNDFNRYLLDCALCKAPHKDPRNLSCGHVLCRDCAQEAAQGGSLICPLCDEPCMGFTTADALPRYAGGHQISGAVGRKASRIRKESSGPDVKGGIVTLQLTPANAPISEVDSQDPNALFVCQECNKHFPMKKLAVCTEHGKFVCAPCVQHKHRTCNSRGCRDIREYRASMHDVKNEMDRLKAEQSIMAEYQARLSAFNDKIKNNLHMINTRLESVGDLLGKLDDDPVAADVWSQSDAASAFSTKLLELREASQDVQSDFHTFALESRTLWNAAKIPGVTKFEVKILHNGMEEDDTELFKLVASSVDVSGLPDAVKRAFDNSTLEKGEKRFWYGMSCFNGDVSGGLLIAEVRPKQIFSLSSVEEAPSVEPSIQSKLAEFLREQVQQHVQDGNPAEGIAFAAQLKYKGTWRCCFGKSGFVRVAGTLAPCMETKVFWQGMEYILFKLRNA